MRLTDFRAVVFDLDDTLYLERDYVLSGFRAVGCYLRQHHAWSVAWERHFVQACWQRFQTGNHDRIFDFVLPRCRPDASRATVEELVAAYRDHRPSIRLEPDADTLLCELETDRLWIVTDGRWRGQQAKVTALDLGRRVRQIILTDRWGRPFWKPHPRAFRRIERLSSAHGRDCVYLADNPAKDFQTPRRLGWATLRVRRRAGLHAACEATRSTAADLELPDLWPLCQAPSARQRRAA
jgi:putative hydrolase of the HAD superfamily